MKFVAKGSDLKKWFNDITMGFSKVGGNYDFGDIAIEAKRHKLIFSGMTVELGNVWVSSTFKEVEVEEEGIVVLGENDIHSLCKIIFSGDVSVYTDDNALVIRAPSSRQSIVMKDLLTHQTNSGTSWLPEVDNIFSGKKERIPVSTIDGWPLKPPDINKDGDLVDVNSRENREYEQEVIIPAPFLQQQVKKALKVKSPTIKFSTEELGMFSCEFSSGNFTYSESCRDSLSDIDWTSTFGSPIFDILGLVGDEDAVTMRMTNSTNIAKNPATNKFFKRENKCGLALKIVTEMSETLYWIGTVAE